MISGQGQHVGHAVCTVHASHSLVSCIVSALRGRRGPASSGPQCTGRLGPWLWCGHRAGSWQHSPIKPGWTLLGRPAWLFVAFVAVDLNCHATARRRHSPRRGRIWRFPRIGVGRPMQSQCSGMLYWSNVHRLGAPHSDAALCNLAVGCKPARQVRLTLILLSRILPRSSSLRTIATIGFSCLQRAPQVVQLANWDQTPGTLQTLLRLQAHLVVA